jgi:DNA-binding MarR family transcriptional regulator
MSKSTGSATQPRFVLDRHLGYWLRLVSNRVSGAFTRALELRHLSAAEWVALNLIERGPDTSPAILADAMGMTRGAVTKVLDKLETKDWISRTTSPADGRVQLISPTRTGSRMLPGLTKSADDNDAHFFDALDADEKATLQKLLRKLAAVHELKSTPVD